MDNSTLDLISNIVSLTLLGASALGFAFKGWISEWITSRFSKAVSKELDCYKHELNKELEAYKNSLIRDLEHYKANVDIQRAIALKMADTRLEALRKLYVAFDEFSSRALLCPSAPLEYKIVRINEAMNAYTQFENEFRQARVFIPLDLNKELADTVKNLAVLVDTKDVHWRDNDPNLQAAFDEYASISNRIRQLIFQPPPELSVSGKGICQ